MTSTWLISEEHVVMQYIYKHTNTEPFLLLLNPGYKDLFSQTFWGKKKKKFLFIPCPRTASSSRNLFLNYEHIKMEDFAIMKIVGTVQVFKGPRFSRQRPAEIVTIFRI